MPIPTSRSDKDELGKAAWQRLINLKNRCDRAKLNLETDRAHLAAARELALHIVDFDANLPVAVTDDAVAQLLTNMNVGGGVVTGAEYRSVINSCQNLITVCENHSSDLVTGTFNVGTFGYTLNGAIPASVRNNVNVALDAVLANFA